MFYSSMLPTRATRAIRTAACVGFMLTLVITGCKSKPKVPQSQQPLPASAADPQEVQRIRDKYFRAYTESAVGVVIATEPSGKPFVAVGELSNMNSLLVNQPVSFLDGSERILATGRIARILPDQVHVQYDVPPPRGGREPRRGDVMVYVPGAARTL